MRSVAIRVPDALGGGLRVHRRTGHAVCSRGATVTGSAVVLYVGINMLLVSQTLFFVQGLAVVQLVRRHPPDASGVTGRRSS